MAAGDASWVMHSSGKRFTLLSEEKQEEIMVLGTETLFTASAKAVQPCATQRLVTKPLLTVQLAVLAASSAKSLGSCLKGLA